MSFVIVISLTLIIGMLVMPFIKEDN